jgi:hypothetical protein
MKMISADLSCERIDDPAQNGYFWGEEKDTEELER